MLEASCTVGSTIVIVLTDVL